MKPGFYLEKSTFSENGVLMCVLIHCLLNVFCPGKGTVGVNINSTSLNQVLSDSLTFIF